MRISRLLRLIRLATSQDVVSVLNRYFKKIELMQDRDLVALYHTVSSFNLIDKDPSLVKMIPTIQRAIIARMIVLIRYEEEKLEKSQIHRIHEAKGPVSDTAKAIDHMMNTSTISRINTLRKKFYAVTNDASFYEG